MALCLVTGGAGFLGSHLVEALVARGDEVRVLDDLRTGDRSNLAHLAGRVELFHAELVDHATLMRACRGIDLIYHFAATADQPHTDSLIAPDRFERANETLGVLTAARDAGVRRVIYASCGSVHAPQTSPVREADATVPLTAEGLAKLIGEHHCIVFTDRYGLETVRLRFFNVFGPRQSPTSPYARGLPGLILAMREAGDRPVTTDAPEIDRDLLHVDDAVYATLLAADHRRATGKVYNVARGRCASLAQLVSVLNELLQTDCRVTSVDPRPTEWLPPLVAITRAETELGFCPRGDLKQDLALWISRIASAADDRRCAAPPGTHGPHFLTQTQSRTQQHVDESGRV